MAEPTEITKNVCYVTMSAMNRLGAPVNDYSWFEQVGVEWLSEVAMCTTGLPSIRVKHIDVPLTKQINLPKDCARYTKIGVEHRGQVWTLTLDDSIMIPPDMNYSSLTDLQVGNGTQTSEFGTNFAPHWWNGNYYGSLFGVGGGFNDSYYRVDWASRTITFLNNFSTRKVIIEYLSDGSDVNADSLVPHLWIEPMRNYIIWTATKFRPSEYRVQSNVENDYLSSLVEAQIASGPNVEEMMDAWWKGSGLKLR